MKPFVVLDPLVSRRPAGWQVHSLRRISRLVEEQNTTGTAPLLSLTIQGGLENRSAEVQPPSDEYLLKYGLVEPGDLVVNPMWLSGGSIGVSRTSGAVSPEYRIYRFNPSVHPPFVHHLVRSAPYMHQYRLLVRAETTFDRRVTKEDFRELPILLPPVPVQRAIADYLDAETTHIDVLIEKRERMRTLLEERRTTFAADALQGGLAEDAKVAPLTVSWLGTNLYPPTWRVMRVKHLCSMRSGDFISGEDIAPTGDYPVYGGNGIRGYSDRFTHAGAFPVIGRQGALCGNVHLASGKFWATEHAVVVTVSLGSDVRWLAEMLRHMNLGQYSVSAAQPGLSVETVMNLDLPFPPLDDQRRIADSLQHTTTQVGKLVSSLERSIQLAQEHRQALITAAVTGELEILAGAA